MEGRVVAPRAWKKSLADYACPLLGQDSVAEVTNGDVLAVLTPTWHTKSATAKKVRQRVRAVIVWAVAQGYRTDDPACEAIRAALPNRRGHLRHHRALPHDRVTEILPRTGENINRLPRA